MRFFLPSVLSLTVTLIGAPSVPAEPPTEAKIEFLLFDTLPWEAKRVTYETAMAPYGFRWNSDLKESARSIQPGMTLFGHPVNELIIRFKDDKPSQITASFYNRGDMGTLSNRKLRSIGSRPGRGKLKISWDANRNQSKACAPVPAGTPKPCSGTRSPASFGWNCPRRKSKAPIPCVLNSSS
jgi:hypothetical protein